MPVGFLEVRSPWRQAALAPFLFTALEINSKAESPHDLRNNAELSDKVVNEVRAGQFDTLESQYRDFTDRERQILPDGTPKNWVFFWSFELG